MGVEHVDIEICRMGWMGEEAGTATSRNETSGSCMKDMLGWFEQGKMAIRLLMQLVRN